MPGGSRAAAAVLRARGCPGGGMGQGLARARACARRRPPIRLSGVNRELCAMSASRVMRRLSYGPSSKILPTKKKKDNSDRTLKMETRRKRVLGI